MMRLLKSVLVSFTSACVSSNKDLRIYVNGKLMGCVCAQTKLLECVCAQTKFKNLYSLPPHFKDI
jgi:hypothetical protein